LDGDEDEALFASSPVSLGGDADGDDASESGSSDVVDEEDELTFMPPLPSIFSCWINSFTTERRVFVNLHYLRAITESQRILRRKAHSRDILLKLLCALGNGFCGSGDGCDTSSAAGIGEGNGVTMVTVLCSRIS